MPERLSLCHVQRDFYFYFYFFGKKNKTKQNKKEKKGLEFDNKLYHYSKVE